MDRRCSTSQIGPISVGAIHELPPALVTPRGQMTPGTTSVPLRFPFPGGPCSSGPLFGLRLVGQIGGPGSTCRTLLVGAIHELPLQNLVHVACQRFFAKWGWLRLPPLLAIFFSIPDSQKFLYEISFVRPLIMWWGNPADWACSIEPPYSARLPPGNMSTTFTGRDFVAKTSHTWRRRTYAVDPADTSGLSGQCSRA